MGLVGEWLSGMSKFSFAPSVAGVLLVAQVLGFQAPLRAQSGRRGAAPACRTGIATYRVVTKGPFTSIVEGSCTFDEKAIEGTCTNDYSDSTGRRFRSVSVTRHASLADVVDEVAVNPPLQRALGTTTTLSGSGTDGTSTSTLEYDAQRRLVSLSAEARPGTQRSTTTYTSWDAAGRPTAATVVSGRQTSTQTFTYDDARRTQTMNAGGGVVCTQTFDENGNPSVGTCAGSTSTTTVLTTQRICK